MPAATATASVRRRTALALLCGLAGCGSLPDASGPRGPPPSERPSPPQAPLSVSDISPESGPEGRLRVRVTVNNAARRKRRALVVVTATVGGTQHVERSRIEILGGDAASTTVTFDVEHDAYAADGSLSAQVRELPDTDTPR